MLNWSKTDLGLEWNLWIYLEWNIYNEIFEYFFHSKHLVGSSSIKTALETIYNWIFRLDSLNPFCI